MGIISIGVGTCALYLDMKGAAGETADRRVTIGLSEGEKIGVVSIVGRPEVDLYPAQMKIRFEKEG